MNSDLPKCVPPVVMDTNAWLSDLHFFSNGYNMFQLLIGAGIGLWETHPSVSSPKCQPVGNFCAFGSASLSQLEVSLCPGRVRTVAQKAPGPSQPASPGGKAMDCGGEGCLLPTASCGLSSCQSDFTFAPYSWIIRISAIFAWIFLVFANHAPSLWSLLVLGCPGPSL